MDNIWSDNKYINLCINILVFLVGINFLHYGQLILPIICFLLFIDNKLVFKVNNPLVFVILCLFGVSFYAFSYKLGFYSVMGFTCPMAYYIGSNIKYPNQINVKKILYLLALSMNLHVILNIIAEFALHGTRGFFYSSTHYDFWTREKISNTGTAINCDLLIGILYYVLFKEKNKRLQYFSIVTLALSVFYLTVIGKRTFMLLLFASFAFLLTMEFRQTKSLPKKVRVFLLGSLSTIFVVVTLTILFYHFDIFSSREYLDQVKIFYKLKDGFINDERISLYFRAWGLMPYHLFGGQEISSILGMPVHEFWLDIYDYAGIVPFVFMIIYSVSFARNMIRLYRNNAIDFKTKIMLFGAYVCIVIQMYLEPIMTGASIFLLVVIIIDGIVDRMVSSIE